MQLGYTFTCIMPNRNTEAFPTSYRGFYRRNLHHAIFHDLSNGLPSNSPFKDHYNRFAIHPHHKLSYFLSHLVVKYIGERLVIESTEKNGDYGLSDLYEINKNGKEAGSSP